MAYNSLSELFTATANAIRRKTGGTDPIVANDFPAAIEGISVGGSTDEEWIGDGNTHLWIHLEEGRTSPMLGVCPNGTVTVDWGDETEPDVLTGTDTTVVQWTPNHEYATRGDYVITLTVDGEMGFGGSVATNEHAYILRYSSAADSRNAVYQNALQKAELGNSVTSIGHYAFNSCYSLASIAIPDSVTSIGHYAFISCYSLASIAIHDSVTSIGDYAFKACYSLASIAIPDSVTSIGSNVFSTCYSLASIAIPDSVTRIGVGAFYDCFGMKFYDFTSCATVPTLVNTSAFRGIAADCEIRVPAALAEEWKAATNWSTYADHIVGV